MVDKLNLGIIQTGGDGFWSNEIRDVKITDIEVDSKEMRVYFDTSTWDVTKHGLIYTDSKFLETLKLKLAQGGHLAGIKVTIEYSEQGLQGEDYVHFDVVKTRLKTKSTEKREFVVSVTLAAEEAWRKSGNGKPVDVCLLEELQKQDLVPAKAS